MVFLQNMGVKFEFSVCWSSSLLWTNLLLHIRWKHLCWRCSNELLLCQHLIWSYFAPPLIQSCFEILSVSVDVKYAIFPSWEAAALWHWDSRSVLKSSGVCCVVCQLRLNWVSSQEKVWRWGGRDLWRWVWVRELETNRDVLKGQCGQCKESNRCLQECRTVGYKAAVAALREMLQWLTSTDESTQRICSYARQGNL